MKKKQNYLWFLLLFAASLVIVVFFQLILTTITVLLIAAVIFIPLVIFYNVGKYKPYLNWDEAFHLETSQGWNIAIYYYGRSLAEGSLPWPEIAPKPGFFSKWFHTKNQPQGNPLHEGTPVILCHGMAANHLGFDLTPDLSLALYLKRAGFPVYNLDLRGSGLSFREGAKKSQDLDFYFDDWVFDFGPIIKSVLSHYNQNHRHRATKVHWIGHSMGAMLPYAAAAVDPKLQALLQTYINLGGPIGVSGISQQMVTTIIKAPKFLIYHLDLKKLAKIFVPLVGKIKTRFEDIFFNHELLDGELLKRYLVYGIENVPRSFANQLTDWLERGIMVNKKYTHTYDEAIPSFMVPTLLINGVLDNFGTSYNMQKGFERLGAKDKKMIILSKENGFGADYCHGGLQFSRMAAREVYPIIANWLREKDGKNL